jgi:hypothetical protein
LDSHEIENLLDKAIANFLPKRVLQNKRKQKEALKNLELVKKRQRKDENYV